MLLSRISELKCVSLRVFLLIILLISQECSSVVSKHVCAVATCSEQWLKSCDTYKLAFLAVLQKRFQMGNIALLADAVVAVSPDE